MDYWREKGRLAGIECGAERESLDLWKPHLPESIRVEAKVHIRVPAFAVQKIKESLLQNRIPFKILIPNIQKLLDSNIAKSSGKSEYDYTRYHTMEEIYRWMNQISVNYSQLVTKYLLGKTYESRPIYCLKISWPSNKTKKIFWMDCGVHGREWISPAFCQWFVKEILESPPSYQKLRKTLQNIDLYILPVLNIDGYIYTWTTDRLWRKSRSPHKHGCFGTDLNRNFDAEWCTVGASTDCLSHVFCGTSPGSEPETKAIINFMESRKSDVLCYLSIHSYGQLIIIPYAYGSQANNHKELVNVAREAATALKKIHGTSYKVGPFATSLCS
ncbi:carboxypeptidase O-like [Rhinatrema bivittatum]|uniref:carboxypeptidase O-like n=1 Tax=Rhinatrema bivittatum TaxID=194408 RepID=UPI0011295B93|nr:carboxypeptidase O-like [Rhinatrema bivittatum]